MWFRLRFVSFYRARGLEYGRRQLGGRYNMHRRKSDSRLPIAPVCFLPFVALVFLAHPVLPVLCAPIFSFLWFYIVIATFLFYSFISIICYPSLLPSSSCLFIVWLALPILVFLAISAVISPLPPTAAPRQPSAFRLRTALQISPPFKRRAAYITCVLLRI